MKKLLAQIMKFGIVGAIAFLIDYGIMVFLTEVFDVLYLISATVSFFVALVFNYFASMRYVFKHKEGLSRRREFIIFAVLSILGLVLNALLMWLGVDLVGFDYRIVKIVVTLIIMLYNFATRKFFLDAQWGT